MARPARDVVQQGRGGLERDDRVRHLIHECDCEERGTRSAGIGACEE